MHEYNGALKQADIALVYFSKHALAIKQLPALAIEKVAEGFNQPGILVMNEKKQLQEWLTTQKFSATNIVLMSSGNYDGIDMLTFAKEVTP